MAGLKENLDSALTNVTCLADHRLPDDQPSIEAAGVTINYDVSFDCNFADRCAFVSGISKFVEDAQSLATLNELLETGKRFAGTIYTWRSCSRGIPAVKSNEQANRKEIYQTTVQVLGPEVQKLRAFYGFQGQAIERFAEEIKKLANPERLKSFVSQTTKLTMAKMLDMFATLDALKDMKACMSNDLALFKRANSFLQGSENVQIDPEDIRTEREMAFFLATQKSITSKLRETLEAVEGFDEVLMEILAECTDLYERQMYVLPQEKYMLLKTMGFALLFLDSGKLKANIYKNKRINVARYDKLFKEAMLVPLYGDMSIKVFNFVQQSPFFDEKQWPNCTAQASDDALFPVLPLDAIKAQGQAYLCELALSHNKMVDGTTRNMSEARSIDLALRGLRLLSSWTCAIMELHMAKLANPADKYRNRDCPDDAEDYQRAIKYNYTSNEIYAIIQTIAMIKSIANVLWKSEATMLDQLKQDMHREMQDFVQNALRDVIRAASKKKKTRAKTVLMGMRETCADWIHSRAPDDPGLQGDKETTKWVPHELPRRHTGPGSTQLYMMRTMLESICIDDKKKSIKHDLGGLLPPSFEEFYHRSWYFAYCLNFNETLSQVADLSQLWYREFFLELTMGKRIQFPIDMSFPWILIHYILESKDPSMIEFVLYPLDLYNDSANFALTDFRKQFLYDEIEAEVDLAFDQFIFLLAEQIFVHYKTVASSMMLNGALKEELVKRNIPLPEVGSHRYTALLTQRHFQLLGRSVDINRLLAQRLNIALQRSIEHAIHRFESGDLSTIMELQMLITNCRLTHELLSEFLSLDPFNEMFDEANESVTTTHGRTTLHVFAELCSDVMPNWVFNSTSNRFVRPDMAPQFGDGVPKRESVPRAQPQYWFGNKQMNHIFGVLTDMFTGYIGLEHFAAITTLLGYGNVAFCIDEMLKLVSEGLRNVLTPYVISLLEGMPKTCKLPIFAYGSNATLGFYQLSLKDVMSYRDFQTEVYHAFREIGNAIICFQLMEQSMMTEEVIDLVQSMPFQGIIPTTVREGEDAGTKRREAAERAAYMRFVSAVQSSGDQERVQLGKQADILTRERMCKALTMFEAVLKRIKTYLDACDADRRCWSSGAPENGVMDVDECNEFHRLWSAIQFTMVQTAAVSHSDVAKQFFGDGLVWAGCTLMALLGQRHRFETFDFAYHIIKIQQVDGKTDVISGVNVADFARYASEKKELNDRVFAIMEKYLPATDAVQCFNPPQHGAFETAV